MAQIELVHEAFDPWQRLSVEQSGISASFGACACFVGSLRDYNEGETIRSMRLDYYPGMTEKALLHIAQSNTATHHLDHALIVHRVGDIALNESIVLVAAWSRHRKQAFEACRAMMEQLKHEAPFWKKEKTEQGSRWVEHNTVG